MATAVTHPVIDEETIQQVASIMREGPLSGFAATQVGYLGGRYVRQLEDEFASFLGVEHAIAIQSATAGLHASLLAFGIGPGDEVIVSPYTFSSSASCVLMVGATPVFADVEPDYFCLDPQDVRRKVTERTRAIIPVHLCGQPADMNALMVIARECHLVVIEDAAQSIGATYLGRYAGTIGNCGVFSFNQSKHISTGEGGMVVTRNRHLADRLRAIRNHGEVSQPDMKLLGYNYRLPEIEACLALAQLRQLKERNDWRLMLTHAMTEALAEFPEIEPPKTREGCSHVYYTYFMKWHGRWETADCNANALRFALPNGGATDVPTDDLDMTRKAFQAAMQANGVYFGGGYVKPLHLMPIYEKFGYKEGDMPVAEHLWRRETMVTDIFRYPMPVERVHEIANVIRKVLRGEP